MSTIINGTSSAITFPDATVQNTAGLTGSSSQLAKAWANFTGNTSSPLTVNGSYNITSITRTALGLYTVNFTNSVSGTYAVAISGASALGQSTTGIWCIVTNQNSNGFSMQCLGSNGANFDITTGNFVVFGS
jgi:hypothetical protein